jgi:hypothetical protein
MKLNLYGPVSDKSVITQVNATVGQNENFANPNRTYVATGDTTTATVSSEDWTNNF